MKKIVVLLLLGVSFLFSAVNLQTASKNELMNIKGIGPKKADQIIEYRKTNVLNSADDLKNIKGFGKGTISNIKRNKTIDNKELAKNQKDVKSKKMKKIDKKKKEMKKIKDKNKS